MRTSYGVGRSGVFRPHGLNVENDAVSAGHAHARAGRDGGGTASRPILSGDLHPPPVGNGVHSRRDHSQLSREALRSRGHALGVEPTGKAGSDIGEQEKHGSRKTPELPQEAESQGRDAGRAEGGDGHEDKAEGGGEDLDDPGDEGREEPPAGGAD